MSIYPIQSIKATFYKSDDYAKLFIAVLQFYWFRLVVQ